MESVDSTNEIQVSYVEVSHIISSTNTDDREKKTIRERRRNCMRKIWTGMRKRMTALKYDAKHNISVTAETRCYRKYTAAERRCYRKYTTVILDGVKHTAM